MIRCRGVWGVLVVVAAALLLRAPALAMTYHGMIDVSRCDPQSNHQTYPGYAPAYYPPGRFYWRDAYNLPYYQPPYATANPTLAIDYRNVSSRTMHAVEFGLVARGTLVAEVRDVGTFSHGAEIKHEFGLNENVFPLGTALASCVPLRIEFADGEHWANPNLPALQRSIYGRP